MDDKLINPIPEFVTAEEREFILAYHKLSKEEKEAFVKEYLPNFQPKDKEE